MSTTTITAEVAKGEPATNMLNIEKFQHLEGSRCNFGATVTGVDANNLSDEQMQQLRRAVWEHKVVVVKNQKGFLPESQEKLVKALDPHAPMITHDDWLLCQHSNTKQIGAWVPLWSIPTAPLVHVIGKGPLGPDHFGLKNQTIRGRTHLNSHADEPSAAAMNNEGRTRFQGWHMDAPLYHLEPAWFTTMWAAKLPRGPDMTVCWDDGTGRSMQVKPGVTAFVSCVQMYDLLSPEERQMADNSWVEYKPFHFSWTKDCRIHTDGLGFVNEGREASPEQMQRYGAPDPQRCKTYPMVWVNPLTKEKALQIQNAAVSKLYLRSSPSEAPCIVDDVKEIRQFLRKLQGRVITPEYVAAVAPAEEGDLVIFDNRACLHSRIDFPDHYGTKALHQMYMHSLSPPVGPAPVFS
ncbi:alpha-ketoglutarate dependent xanthine dioxygenase [Diplodia corticola]|uniref:Alpha-ketoglutarate dependent xanthine dioxygenase n=1 Tax=Diplodia corticola TaxID=236234 RepID=A0A1J9QUD7_9PEZI|nr:alpha-ketoglutarate dependent xanthine dioxygenase [Diplodia corticola]OJD32582.1 alpha-ketoglutarate dependent xanthine dioxygenase [Diplodia corticola]